MGKNREKNRKHLFGGVIFLKICLVGDFSENRDEGLKNIAHYLAEELSKHHDVMRFDVNRIFSPKNLISLKKFKPQIIHYIPGPTIKSFLITKTLGKYCKAKTVMSAPQPKISPFFKRLIYLIRPNLILVQSKKSESLFKSFGIQTDFLPNGVDIQKFIPVSQDTRIKLRYKYRIKPDKFTILHVGHLMARRNLEVFKEMKNEDTRILIVASEYLRFDNRISKKLKNAGCIVFNGYYKNIEEIYALADCYIFPVKKGYTILTPLSVMEAMACNLPVITTKFEGLTAIFEEGEGLIFVENEDDILIKLEKLKADSPKIRNRGKVLPYSWDNIAKKLVKNYGELLNY